VAPILTPKEPLSQVVFVHDYFQLVFQGESFSIYNVAKIKIGNDELLQGSHGFCDALVRLTGQHIVAVSRAPEIALSLSFEGGAILSVLAGPEGAQGPEAFQFIGHENRIVVEQNA
jgi:hypothetical protein